MIKFPLLKYTSFAIRGSGAVNNKLNKKQICKENEKQNVKPEFEFTTKWSRMNVQSKIEKTLKFNEN